MKKSILAALALLIYSHAYALTANRVVKASSNTYITNSGISDDGVNVYIQTEPLVVGATTTISTEKLRVVGGVSATSFSGDGSALTGISSGAISGVIPVSSGGTGESSLANVSVGSSTYATSAGTATNVSGGSVNATTGYFSGPYPYIDARSYGAVPSDGNDDTSAIQLAINAAQTAGAKVRFEPGTYVLSSTLTVSGSASAGFGLIGSGKIKTIFYRSTDYGTTLVVGTTSSVTLDSISIEFIWFYHDFGGYENGLSTTTLVNKPTIGAHIVAQGLTRSHIKHCMFWNMPTNIDWYGGSESTIEDNNFRGVYDSSPTKTQLQVTAQSIRFQKHAAGQVPTSMWIVNNKFTGYLSEVRGVVYGTSTVNQSENIGPFYGIRIDAAEDLQIRGGEFGGHNNSAIMMVPNASDALLNIGISGGIMFDGQKYSAINIQNSDAAQTAYNIEIVGNHFVGQDNSKFAITIGTVGDTLPSATGVTIANNNFVAYAEGVISLNNAYGANVSGNNARDYNSAGGNFSSSLSATGIYVGADSRQISLTGNILGGGNLYEAYTGTGANNCVYGVFIDPAALSSTSYSNIVDGGINTSNTIVMSF